MPSPYRPAAGLHTATRQLRVAVVTINYHPEPTGISVYSTGLAEFLFRRGHEVRVFTGFPYYPAWKKTPSDEGRLFASEDIDGVKVLRNYVYVPSKPTALRRIFHELSFSISALVRYLFSRRCDVTIVVSPPLLLAFLISFAGQIKKSLVLVHVQDLQPDAAIDLGMLKPGRFTDVLFAIERLTYSLAYRVSTISSAMRENIISKGVPKEKTILFKNWADETLIKPLPPSQSLRNAWQLTDRFVVLYAGNMGVKQGLWILLKAAEAMLTDPDVVFVIVGDGGEKPDLVERAQRAGLMNVVFKSLVPREQLSQLLATADVSVITQKPGIDDLVLPSKLGNLLASSRPLIICTATGSELSDIAHGADCGIVIDPDDVNGLVAGIRHLRSNSEDSERMAKNGVVYVRSHLGKDAILSEFSSTVEYLTYQRSAIF